MKTNQNNKNILHMIVRIVLDITFIVCICYCTSRLSRQNETQEKEQNITYTEFLSYVQNEKVESIHYVAQDEEIEFKLKDKKGNYKTENPKYEEFKKEMLEAGIKVHETKNMDNYITYIFSGASLIMMFVFFFIFDKKTKGEKMFEIKKNNPASLISFKDIAGLEEVKQDLSTIVDFLKNPKKYQDAGAKLPKGILLYGPPGTGKTMLAKAIAGEAGVEFISTVASEFDEMYVGVGASRVRKMFEEAKKKAPCIIFVDELDVLGKRGNNKTHTERQTVNQFLSEMDGFNPSDGIIVIAATNRLEDLDSALTRPGRFDSHFAVPLPANASDRKEIIDIYIKNKKIDESVDLNILAKETLGLSPADIESVINEAAIIAVKNNNGVISKECIDDSFYKQVMKGHKKKDMERKEEEIALTAWHEAGHALLGVIFGQEVTKVTIIPSTSGAGGITFFNQKKMGLYSKKELLEKLMVLYGGRAAEVIFAGEENITTGASSDISEATNIISSMITNYGMSELGLLNMEQMLTKRIVSADTFLTNSREIAKQTYQQSYDILMKHKECLEIIAKTLIEKETITGDEIKIIFLDNKKK